MIERFGHGSRHSLYFTLRNDTSEDREVMVSL